MYTGSKVIGIAKRTKIKTDSSLIFQLLYLFFHFYTVIVWDYFSVTVSVLADEISIFSVFHVFSFPFPSTGITMLSLKAEYNQLDWKCHETLDRSLLVYSLLVIINRLVWKRNHLHSGMITAAPGLNFSNHLFWQNLLQYFASFHNLQVTSDWRIFSVWSTVSAVTVTHVVCYQHHVKLSQPTATAARWPLTNFS